MTQPTHSDLQRDVGRIEGAFAAMEKRMDTLEKTVTEGFEKVSDGLDKIDRRLATIEAKEAERKGAWKVIALVAGGVSALVASVIKYLMG
jgi:CHASE3 domain sensor protein